MVDTLIDAQTPLHHLPGLELLWNKQGELRRQRMEKFMEEIILNSKH